MQQRHLMRHRTVLHVLPMALQACTTALSSID